MRGRVERKHERDVVGADPGRLSDRARFATALRRLSILRERESKTPAPLYYIYRVEVLGSRSRPLA